MRSIADYFGLLAYLFVMLGRPPDAQLVQTAAAKGSRSRLRVIEGSLGPQPYAMADEEAEEVAA